MSGTRWVKSHSNENASIIACDVSVYGEKADVAGRGSEQFAAPVVGIFSSLIAVAPAPRRSRVEPVEEGVPLCIAQISEDREFEHRVFFVGHC